MPSLLIEFKHFTGHGGIVFFIRYHLIKQRPPLRIHAELIDHIQQCLRSFADFPVLFFKTVQFFCFIFLISCIDHIPQHDSPLFRRMADFIRLNLKCICPVNVIREHLFVFIQVHHRHSGNQRQNGDQNTKCDR